MMARLPTDHWETRHFVRGSCGRKRPVAFSASMPTPRPMYAVPDFFSKDFEVSGQLRLTALGYSSSHRIAGNGPLGDDLIRQNTRTASVGHPPAPRAECDMER